MITLRVITEDNYQECLALHSTVECERHVDSVAYSLAEAWIFYEETKPFAIYHQDQMIGFVSMYIGDNNPQIINFFIIDAYKGKGYGTEAVKICIHYLEREHDAQRISVPVEVTNVMAQIF